MKSNNPHFPSDDGPFFVFCPEKLKWKLPAVIPCATSAFSIGPRAVNRCDHQRVRRTAVHTKKKENPSPYDKTPVISCATGVPCACGKPLRIKKR